MAPCLVPPHTAAAAESSGSVSSQLHTELALGSGLTPGDAGATLLSSTPWAQPPWQQHGAQVNSTQVQPPPAPGCL